MVDLGAWLDEKYTIPAPLDDESAGEGESEAAVPPARRGWSGRRDD
jgi:endogenous inhibitor of DNA gyrase (YacG/DUF329 family)